MARGELKNGRCLHEPVVQLTNEQLERLSSTGTLAFAGQMAWTCAKCKRYLNARWYPKVRQ